MSSTRNIIRAFLASPGDLEEERQVVRDVVNEFNESWADVLEYHIELVGWEETVAGYGRPQQLINQDLDRCDLFLGMMWKRWGTPPDTDGKYSSGFEEEFLRSLDRRGTSGSPEVSLLFKDIPSEFLADPGSDLKRVLDFKESIIAEKKILFQTFSSTKDLEVLARKRISSYVNSLRARDQSSFHNEENSKKPKQDHGSEPEEAEASDSSSIAKEGFQFLEELVDRLRKPDPLDSLTSCDVARFRLLANSFSKSGNDEVSLGVHDINLLFFAKMQGVTLGPRETQALMNFGLRHLRNQNTPFWSWYAKHRDSPIDPVILTAGLKGNENERIGALSILSALGKELPEEDDYLKREWVVDNWLSEITPTNVKIAALKYLARFGTKKDWKVVQSEYERSDHATARKALECMVSIALRFPEQHDPRKLILSTQFESIDKAVLDAAMEDLVDVPSKELRLGLEHRNSQLRSNSLRILNGRGEIELVELNHFLDDPDVSIRSQAIMNLENKGQELPEEQVKKILTTPGKSTSLFGTARAKNEIGERLFKDYKFRRMREIPEAELIEQIESSSPYDAELYFALVSKNPKRFLGSLRKNLDDRFEQYFDDRVSHLAKKLGADDSNSTIKQVRSLGSWLRKSMTRKALDFLCQASDSQDITRIRKNLIDGYCGISELDAQYLANHGKWSDISLLANTKRDPIASSSFVSEEKPSQDHIVKSIYKLAKNHSISDLLSIEMHDDILREVINACPASRYKTISQKVLVTLLDHKSEQVRKSAVTKAVIAFTAKRLKKTLGDYSMSEKIRYYNVIHWLDLGAEMTRVEARQVAYSADY